MSLKSMKPKSNKNTQPNDTFNQIMKFLSKGALLMSEKDKSSCESLLKNSLFSSNMLLNLINDLLDLAKMENSQFHLNNDLFNLHDVIKKALETLGFQAQQKNIKLSYAHEESNYGYFTNINGDSYRYQ